MDERCDTNSAEVILCDLPIADDLGITIKKPAIYVYILLIILKDPVYVTYFVYMYIYVYIYPVIGQL